MGSRPISHWIVADLNTADGRSMLYAAIRQLVSDVFYVMFLSLVAADVSGPSVSQANQRCFVDALLVVGCTTV